LDVEVTVSVTITCTDSHVILPGLVILNRKAYSPIQVIIPSYEIVKAAAGVGVGGLGTTGRACVLPITVAYCPHNQQVMAGLEGNLITQVSPVEFRPTTSADDPTGKIPRILYAGPGPDRQLVSTLTLTMGTLGVLLAVGWGVSDGVWVISGILLTDAPIVRATIWAILVSSAPAVAAESGVFPVTPGRLQAEIMKIIVIAMASRRLFIGSP
jgi:hypothetical protein